MKKFFAIAGVVALSLVAAACTDDAKMVNKNLTKAADNFELVRNIVFYNTWTDTEVVSVTGLCSLEIQAEKIGVICKEPGGYKKHHLGKTTNLSYFSVQLESKDVSAFHPRIVWKPQQFIPDIDLRVDGGELVTDRH